MLLAPFLRGFSRQMHVVCLAFAAFSTAVFAQVGTPSAADGFDPNVDGNVYVVVAQPDGKLIVGGQFANVQPNGGISVSRSNIARFNADGSFDPDFNPGTDGPVRAIVLQPNGQIVIGGDFTSVGGKAHNYVARLNADGTTDERFTASIGRSTNPRLAVTPQVFALALQPDGSVIVGGTFGSAQSQGIAITTRNNLARFTSGGALDLTYDPNPNAMVLSLAMHVDNKVVVGGQFTQFQENGKSSPTARLRVARLNPSGTLDSEFDPKADNGVTALAVQRDGKILLGGYFTTLQPIGNAAATQRNHLARLNIDGTLDSEFYPSVGGSVLAVSVAPDGAILVGGRFAQLLGRGNVTLDRSNIARLLLDGTPDDSFTANVNADVDAIAIQPDGRIVIGGYFTRSLPAVGVQLIRNHLARLQSDGALDTSFQVQSDGRALASVTLPDGRIIVGGTFVNLGGVTRNYLARLNADGTVDSTYTPKLDGPVYAMALDKNNKLLIGGNFSKVGTDDRFHLARLNADGSVDSEFNVKLDGPVGSILVLSGDGGMLVAGSFGNVQPFNASTATARGNLVKLGSDGSVDASYNPNTNAGISSMALQSDGKLIVVGNFTSLQPGATGDIIARRYVARINTDGKVDSGYNVQTESAPSVVAVQSDDAAIYGGRFRAIVANNGTEIVQRDYIARVNKDGSLDTAFDPKPNNMVLTIKVSDSSILIGGLFTILTPNGATSWKQAKYVARLNKDGTLDETFANALDIPEIAGTRVDLISPTANGDFLIGGNFSAIGQPRLVRTHLARVKASGQVDAGFDPHPSGGATGVVNAITMQPDGKILVGGTFSDLGGATSTNLARFRPEGVADDTFNGALSTDGVVNALAVRATGAVAPTQLGGFAWLQPNGNLLNTFQPNFRTEGRINVSLVLPDGSVLLGGTFNDLSNTVSGSLVKVSATGQLDPSFAPNVNGAVYGLLRQPDGKIIVFGNFTTVAGASVPYLARLNADGTLDAAFNPNPNAAVIAAVLDSSNNVIIGGNFTSLSPGATSSGSSSTTTSTVAATPRNFIARLNSAGSIDNDYNPNLNGVVLALALQPDGNLVVGGNFTSATPGTTTTAITRNRIARFDPKGNLDTGFDPNADAAVYAVQLQPTDQKILIGGDFRSVGGKTHLYLARLNTDGSSDEGFTPAANTTVKFIGVAPDNAIVISGFFTTVTSSGSSTPIARTHAARLSSAGVLDASFNPDLGGQITGMTVNSTGVLIGGSFTSVNPTGLILVGGAFNTLGGLPQKNLGQLNGDGSVLGTFQPNPDGAINALLPLPDGRFVVGGTFTTIAGQARSGIARFNADGSLDSSFNPTIVGGVATLALQTDGRILAGLAQSGLIRLNTDGTIDGSFSAGAPFAPAVAIAVQADGRIVVAGTGSGTDSRVVRLNADGSVDATFATVTAGGGSVRTLTPQADGRIIVAGSFTTIGGQAIANLARLTTTGAVDPTFNPGPDGTVNALALQSDGRVLLGGSFTKIGGLQRPTLARIGNTGPASQTLGVSSAGR
jgi:uncharacterized delta-60 repeat protein